MSLATDSLRLVRGSHDSQAGHFGHSNHFMGENLDLQTGSTWLNFSQSSLQFALLTVATVATVALGLSGRRSDRSDWSFRPTSEMRGENWHSFALQNWCFLGIPEIAQQEQQ